MAVIYKKNAQNVYKMPLYRLFCFWWLLILGLAIASSVVGLVVSIKVVQLVLWSIVIILMVVRAYLLARSVLDAKSLRVYITQKKQSELSQKVYFQQ